MHPLDEMAAAAGQEKRLIINPDGSLYHAPNFPSHIELNGALIISYTSSIPISPSHLLQIPPCDHTASSAPPVLSTSTVILHAIAATIVRSQLPGLNNPGGHHRHKLPAGWEQLATTTATTASTLIRGLLEPRLAE